MKLTIILVLVIMFAGFDNNTTSIPLESDEIISNDWYLYTTGFENVTGFKMILNADQVLQNISYFLPETTEGSFIEIYYTLEGIPFGLHINESFGDILWQTTDIRYSNITIISISAEISFTAIRNDRTVYTNGDTRNITSLRPDLLTFQRFGTFFVESQNTTLSTIDFRYSRLHNNQTAIIHDNSNGINKTTVLTPQSNLSNITVYIDGVLNSTVLLNLGSNHIDFQYSPSISRVVNETRFNPSGLKLSLSSTDKLLEDYNVNNFVDWQPPTEEKHNNTTVTETSTETVSSSIISTETSIMTSTVTLTTSEATTTDEEPFLFVGVLLLIPFLYKRRKQNEQSN